MAGRGPTPKPRDQQRHRIKQPDEILVEEDAELRGPELPDYREWCRPTREWWDTWRRSAQAVTMLDTDWSFMVDTALMHDAMWTRGQWTLAAEVRLRVAKFGATPEDRQRLRLKVEAPDRPPKTPGGPDLSRPRYAHLRDVSA